MQISVRLCFWSGLNTESMRLISILQVRVLVSVLSLSLFFFFLHELMELGWFLHSLALILNCFLWSICTHLQLFFLL